jgi:hypothetical protein
MIGADVVVADREQGEGTKPGELGMTGGNGRPGGFDRAAFGKIDFELFASERLSIPREETNPDAHR